MLKNFKSFIQIKIRKTLDNQKCFREKDAGQVYKPGWEIFEAFANMHSGYLQIKRHCASWYLPNLNSKFSPLHNVENNINYMLIIILKDKERYKT